MDHTRRQWLTVVMNETYEKLQCFLVRERIILLFEIHSDVDFVTKMGGFEMLELIHYLLPIDDRKAELALSLEEMRATLEFLKLAAAATEVTTTEGWTKQEFLVSPEWSALRDCAQNALDIFGKRGRYLKSQDGVLSKRGASVSIDNLDFIPITTRPQ